MKNNRLNQLFALLETNPEDEFLNYALALEQIKLEADEKAATVFAKLYAIHPQYLPQYYHYGLCLARLGRTQEAGEVLRKGSTVAKSQHNSKTLAEIEFAYEDVMGEEME